MTNSSIFTCGPGLVRFPLPLDDFETRLLCFEDFDVRFPILEELGLMEGVVPFPLPSLEELLSYFLPFPKGLLFFLPFPEELPVFFPPPPPPPHPSPQLPRLGFLLFLAGFRLARPPNTPRLMGPRRGRRFLFRSRWRSTSVFPCLSPFWMFTRFVIATRRRLSGFGRGDWVKRVIPALVLPLK